MKVIVYNHPLGVVAACFPCEGARQIDETDDAFAARIAATDVPSDTPFLILDESQLPDPQFQEAWVIDFDAGTVTIDDALKTALENVSQGTDRIATVVGKRAELKTSQAPVVP